MCINIHDNFVYMLLIIKTKCILCEIPGLWKIVHRSPLLLISCKDIELGHTHLKFKEKKRKKRNLKMNSVTNF